MDKKKYIEVKAAVKILKRKSLMMFNSYYMGYTNAIKDFAEMPAADVQEVRHGYWKERMSTLSSVKCSECGNSHEYDAAYYPSCGARMDGKEVEK